MRVNVFKDQLTGRVFEVVGGKISEALSFSTQIDKVISEYDINSLKFFEKKSLSGLGRPNETVYILTFNDNARLELVCDLLDEVILDIAIENMKRPDNENGGEEVRHLTTSESRLVDRMKRNRVSAELYDWVFLWFLTLALSGMALNWVSNSTDSELLLCASFYTTLIFATSTTFTIIIKSIQYAKNIHSKSYLHPSEIQFLKNK